MIREIKLSVLYSAHRGRMDSETGLEVEIDNVTHAPRGEENIFSQACPNMAWDTKERQLDWVVTVAGVASGVTFWDGAGVVWNSYWCPRREHSLSFRFPRQKRKGERWGRKSVSSQKLQMESESLLQVIRILKRLWEWKKL